MRSGPALAVACQVSVRLRTRGAAAARYCSVRWERDAGPGSRRTRACPRFASSVTSAATRSPRAGKRSSNTSRQDRIAPRHCPAARALAGARGSGDRRRCGRTAGGRGRTQRPARRGGQSPARLPPGDARRAEGPGRFLRSPAKPDQRPAGSAEGALPANIRRPWPGAACPRPVQASHTRADPQRGSREAGKHSGTGAHPRRRPADLEAGLAPSLNAGERPSRTSQPASRTKIR
jgi:hypothetical protein